MISHRNAVYLRQPFIDTPPAQIAVEHAQADWRGVIDGFDFGQLGARARFAGSQLGTCLVEQADIGQRQYHAGYLILQLVR